MNTVFLHTFTFHQKDKQGGHMDSFNFLLDLRPFKFAIYQKGKIIFSYNILNHDFHLKLVEADWDNFNYKEITYIPTKKVVYAGLRFSHLGQDYIVLSKVDKSVTANWNQFTWKYYGNIIFHTTQIFEDNTELKSKQKHLDILDDLPDALPLNNQENNGYTQMYQLEQHFNTELKNGNAEASLKTAQKLLDTSYKILDKSSIKGYLSGFVNSVSRFVIQLGAPIADTGFIVEMILKQISKANHNDLDELIPLIVVEFYQLATTIPSQYDSIIVNRTISFINQNLYANFTNNDIAEYLSISISYLSSHFKAVTGESLKSYILKKKIEEAKQLLIHSNLQINDISYRLNFSSQSHFTKIFKDETGHTPHIYRNLFFNAY